MVIATVLLSILLLSFNHLDGLIFSKSSETLPISSKGIAEEIVSGKPAAEARTNGQRGISKSPPYLADAQHDDRERRDDHDRWDHHDHDRHDHDDDNEWFDDDGNHHDHDRDDHDHDHYRH